MKLRKSTKTWQKTRKPNLLRHKSGRYYARAFAGGKEVWKSLKTSHFSVAQAKLAEFLKEHRQRIGNEEDMMGSPVTWFEINSDHPTKLHEFYAKAFGWKMQPVMGTNSAMVDTDSGAGIAGSIGEAQGVNQVTFYIEVDDPQSHLDRVESLGGKTTVPVTEIPDVVTFAQFADPDGNVVGLFRSPV